MSSWSEILLKDFLNLKKEPTTIRNDQSYRQLTVALQARGVRLRDTKQGSDIRTKKQYVVHGGQFIYSRIDARNGAFGIVPYELEGAVVTGDFPTFDINQEIVNPQFLRSLICTKGFIESCKKDSRGVTNRKRLKETQFLEISVRVPSISEQERIVAYIEQVILKLNTVKKLQVNTNQLQNEFSNSLLGEMIKDMPRRIMRDVAPIIRRSADIQKEKDYPELGIRSFGKGTFHKPSIKGSDIGSKRLYRIEPGDLLFSNVFAWEGAIAVAQPHDKGRYGSHRFITCLPVAELVTANYLRNYFLSREGHAQIRAASPGAAGRNKTLNLKKLEAIEVPVPPIEQQHHFDILENSVSKAFRIQSQCITELDTLLPAVIDKAFKGEV